MTMNPCPLCGKELRNRVDDQHRHDTELCDCPNCGSFAITDIALEAFEEAKRKKPLAGPLVSFTVHQMQRSNHRPMVDQNLLDNILSTSKLPTPLEQADRLLLDIGDKYPTPGEHTRVNMSDHVASVGAIDDEGVSFVTQFLIDQDFLRGHVTSAGATVQVSMRGWEHLEILKRQQPESRRAFMAMPFNDTELDRVYRECFVPAVSATGFTLRRVDDDPQAGLIDDRLRVEIQTSRFLIAELTHGNRGAYWEAGFAEGLGKPVIYTCKREYFDRTPPYDNEGGAHFDTNHHLTVVWDLQDLAKAIDKLKNTIRATLPAEATMHDD